MRKLDRQFVGADAMTGMTAVTAWGTDFRGERKPGFTCPALGSLEVDPRPAMEWASGRSIAQLQEEWQRAIRIAK
jgi:hypothetical protein